MLKVNGKVRFEAKESDSKSELNSYPLSYNTLIKNYLKVDPKRVLSKLNSVKTGIDDLIYKAETETQM